MHNATANRTAWRLQLPRILRFPKYFLAPRPLLLHRPTRVALPFFSDRLPNRPAVAAALLMSPPVAARLSENYRLKSFNRPFAWPGSSQARLPAATLATKNIRQIKAGNISWRSEPTATKIGLHDQRVSISTNYRPRGPDKASSWSLPRPIVRAARVLQFTHPMAELALSSRTAGIRASHSPVTQTFTANRRASAMLRAEPPSPGEPIGLAPSSEVDSPSGQTDFKPTSRDDREPNDASAPATLHIDGSALGRWTIQHLEHVLAKPTAGITGVDPRANTPRGRVSPF
jgi:hypothetical protein